MPQPPQTMTDSAPVPPSDPLAPAPLDRLTPQLTLRAILTGMLLGGLLSACNIYGGLKVGWGFNMSIVAVLLSYAFWGTLHVTVRTRPWTILENNLNQTAASSGAAVSSAGLVAAIPALTLLTGQTLPWHWLALWVFSVCIVGITVAIPLRRQMIVVDKLPFPSGIATAQTLKEMYAKGHEATLRVLALLSGAVVSAAVTLMDAYTAWIQQGWIWLTRSAETPRQGSKLAIPFLHGGAWSHGIEPKTLAFSLNTTGMMYAVGVITGPRAGCWMLIGSVLAWLVIAPPLIDNHTIRLPISEPMLALPAEVVGKLPQKPAGFARFNADKRQLEFEGVMKPTERDFYRNLSEDRRWRETIDRLYTRSQLEIAAPLAALPAGISLGDGAVRYDTKNAALIARRGISAAEIEGLRKQSADPMFDAALDELAVWFAYGTTREIRFAAKLDEWPSDYYLPVELKGRLERDRNAEAIVAVGVIADADVALVQKSLNDWKSAGGSAASADAVLKATQELRQRSQQPLFDPTRIPEPFRASFSYDPMAQTIQSRGVFTAAHRKAFAELAPGNKDLDAALAAQVAATQYSPPVPTFASVTGWLLWPGVTLMVVSSLVSFAFSWGSIARSFSALRGSSGADSSPEDIGEVAPRWFISALAIAFVLSVVLQVYLFSIVGWVAAVGVLMSFAMALVAARVAGETNTTPVGAMGKVTQLLFGVISPGSPAPNLMAANVTGGAASQCADLLHDLKTGYLLGATPRYQAIAQTCGALGGSLLGSLWYLILIHDPQTQIFSSQWAAPAVATWKAVAELFAIGISALPEGAPTAILIAAIVGVILPLLEKFVPSKGRLFVPSAAALGLAFVVNAHDSIAMFIGGLIALLMNRFAAGWSARFLIAIAAGVVAGESLTGVGVAVENIISAPR